MHFQWKLVPVVLLAAGLPACADLGSLYEDFANPCGAGGCRIPQRPCGELAASAFSWSIRGFGPADILDSDLRNQAELTAILHVGDARRLRVSATSLATSEDCSSKAATVDWRTSNPAVVRLETAESPREASLVASRAGDTVVSADIAFEDGTPTLRVLPWSFTNVGSGTITLVRVVP